MTLFCAFNWIFDECPVPTLSWIGNTVSPNEASSRTSYFSELTFTPRPQDHNTELTCRVDFSREGVSTENTVRLSVACESGGGKDCGSRLEGWGGGERQLGDDRQLLAALGEEGEESRDAGLGPGRGTRLTYGPLSASASWALMRRLSSRGTVTLSFP